MAYCVNGCWTVLSNVGIGTDDLATYHPGFMSPSLNIVGSRPGINLENSSGTLTTIRLKGTAAAGEMHINFDGSSCTAGSLSFYTYGCANRQTLTLGLNGNVGIGTTAPLTLLHTNSSTDNLTTFQAGSGYGVQLRFRHGSSLTGFINSNTTNIFSIFDGSSNELVSVSSAGNISIGTSASTTYKAFNFINDANTNGNVLAISRNAAQFLTNAGAGDFIIGVATGKNVLFGNTQTGTTEYMRIACNGNVGIGTSAPANAIHVCRAAGSATLALQIGGLYNYFFGNGCCMGMASDSGASGIKFHISRQAPDDAMLITQAGNVGINCASPSYKLHVNGTFYAAGSSQDYKQSICNYNTDSCMFMKLKPVTYQYKEEYCHLGKELKSGTQIGLIAEEVAETYPELAILVNEEANKVVRNVDYEKLSIVLLSEVQKLRREVDDLKHKQ